MLGFDYILNFLNPKLFFNFKAFEIPENHLMSKPEIEITFDRTHF